MLELKNIIKNYYVDKEPFVALKGINLTFNSNEFCSILGPSGCGKTTLLNIIGGLDHYTSGDLIIDCTSTKDFKDSDWDNYRNKKIGFVFQSYNLIQHLSILENVELSLTLAGIDKSSREKRAKEALNKVGLEGIYNKKPNQLSGGQQQRVAIARALINDPEIILADEPTGALDSKTSIQVMDILKEVSKDRLVIMVTHNKELAESYSSRIIRLKDGEIESDSLEKAISNEVEITNNHKKERTSMSFLSAFKTSLKNLLTKKGRTIATSVASSFGIIGVALVLAMSNGLNGYISKIESQTVATLPINVASVVKYSKPTNEEDLNPEYPDDELLRPEIPLYGQEYEYKTSNLNSKFLNYVEKLKTEKELVSSYFNIYSTNYSMNLATSFGDEIKIVDNSSESGMVSSIMSSYIGLPSTPFHVLYGEKQYIMENYDLVYGEYPNLDNPNEIVLVVDNKNQIPFKTLQKLGFYNEYDSEMEANKNPISFEDVINKKYKLLFNDSLYEKADIDISRGKYIYSENSVETLFNSNDSTSGMELKITGILRPTLGSTVSIMPAGLCYQTSLIEEFDRINQTSKVQENLGDNLKLKVNLTIDLFKQSLLELLKSNSYIGSENAVKFNVLFDMFLDFTPLFKVDESKTFGASNYIAQISRIGADYGVNSDNIYKFNNDIILKIEEMFDLYSLGGDNTEFYNELLEFISYVNSYSKIRSVVIFPTTIDAKKEILKELDNYNLINEEDSENHAINENEKIYYIDAVSDLTESMSIMINTVSIVLIIFASISLLVSSVMTSIITYVSVVERTKEIGVLRALGARKKDVGRLFKAECFIIGLISGIFGVVVTYLLSIPINLILNAVFPTYGLGNIASLHIIPAVILIIVSVILSYFSGLIPARIAAKKDPVIALRTE